MILNDMCSTRGLAGMRSWSLYGLSGGNGNGVDEGGVGRAEEGSDLPQFSTQAMWSLIVIFQKCVVPVCQALSRTFNST